jgi:outer membrane lipoprotein-sorting protein
MAPYESGDTPAKGPLRPDGYEGADAAQERKGHRAARYVVPFAVIGVAAATIGLVPALADSGDPDLPQISAQQLIQKIAASNTQQLSGTVKINTDLGLPDFGGLGAFAPGATGTGGASGHGMDGGASAAPQSRLMELASGAHTLRVAVNGPDHRKLSVLDNASEYSVIRNGADLWTYDSASNQAYHAKTPAASGQAPGTQKDEKDVPTPDQLAKQAIKAAQDNATSVTVQGTERVANRDAYRLVIKPNDSDTTVGTISIAVDASNGTPLKFTLTPAQGGSAVVDAGYTAVDFSAPAASTFDFTPPKGTKVTEAKPHAPAHQGTTGQHRPGDVKVVGKAWDSVAEFSMAGGQSMPSTGSGRLPSGASKMLESLGDRTQGKFGSGTVFSTRLINALITDDGKIYAGAVTKDALVKAANDAS